MVSGRERGGRIGGRGEEGDGLWRKREKGEKWVGMVPFYTFSIRPKSRLGLGLGFSLGL